MDFAYTFIFRDEVVEFLLRVRNAADAVFFCDKVAGMGVRLAGHQELDFFSSASFFGRGGGAEGGGRCGLTSEVFLSEEGTYPKPSRSVGNTGSLGRLLLLRRNMMCVSWVSSVAVVFVVLGNGEKEKDERKFYVLYE